MDLSTKITKNYHTHTLYCGHAVGNPEDYVKVAIDNGYEILGFSDHAYTLDCLKFTMSKEGMDEYYKEVNSLKAKYQNMLTILCGLEVDYFPHLNDYYQSLKDKYDYLGLSVHFYKYDPDNISKYGSGSVHTKEQIDEYTSLLIEGMNTKLFKYAFHPDFFIGEDEWNDDYYEASVKIIEAAIRNNVYLEFNAQGIRKGLVYKNGKSYYRYPRLEFWKLAKEMNALIIIGADAHDPVYLADDVMNYCIELLKSL